MWGNRGDRVGAFLDDGNEIVGKYTCSGTVMLDAKLRGEITANDTLVITYSGGGAIIYGATTDNVTNDPSVQFMPFVFAIA